MDSTEEIAVRLAIRDREQFQRDSTSAAESVESIGTATTKAADMADASSKRFGMFGSKVKSAGVAGIDAMGMVGTKAGAAFGDGFYRDANGRLRAANGAFAKEGTQIGATVGSAARVTADGEVSAIGGGATRSRLASRFRLTGEMAGAEFGKGAVERSAEYIKTIGGSLLLFFGAEKVKESLTEGFKLANDSVKAQRVTAAALKSTHDASNMSAKGVHELAEQLSQVSAQSPIATQGLENMLLTFPKIHKGNGVFREASMLSQDMAVRLGTSLPGAAKMLGRALNDPVKSLGGLSRAGVMLGVDQTKTIASLVAPGNLAMALAIIHKAVHDRVAGAAAASVTPTERLHLAWENFSESLAKKARPTIDKFMNWLAGDGIKDLKKFGTSVSHSLGPPVHQVIDFMKKTGIPAIKTFFGWLDKHQGTVKQLVKWFFVFYGVLKTITISLAVFNAVMDADPIVLTVIALAALVTGFIYAYKHSETFREVITTLGITFKTVFNAIKTVVMDVVGFAIAHWKLFVSVFAGLMFGPVGVAIAFVITHFHKIKSVAITVFHDVVGAAQDVGHGFMKYIAHPIEDAYGHVKHWGGNILDFIGRIPSKIGKALAGLGKIILAPWQWAFHYIAIAWNNSAGRIGFHTPGWLGPLGHKGFSIPKIGVPPLPALAKGGAVVAGRTYLVGERGPELFTSPVAGIVIPNSAMRGGDGASAPAVMRRHLPATERTEHTAVDADGEMGGQPLVLQTILDGKVLAESVYKVTRGKVARL